MTEPAAESTAPVSNPPAYTVEAVAAAAIIDLRHRVLRPGRPREAAMFDGDDLPTSHHFAAIDRAGRVIGCVSFHLKALDGEPAWQLRGVAADAGWCGRGVGRQVLLAGEAVVAALGPRLMWCNARRAAVGFYERLGWRTCSEQFDIPTVGPHYRMKKRAIATALGDFAADGNGGAPAGRHSQ